MLGAGATTTQLVYLHFKEDFRLIKHGLECSELLQGENHRELLRASEMTDKAASFELNCGHSESKASYDCCQMNTWKCLLKITKPHRNDRFKLESLHSGHSSLAAPFLSSILRGSSKVAPSFEDQPLSSSLKPRDLCHDRQHSRRRRTT